MARDLEKTAHSQDEEIVLAEPLLPLAASEDELHQRERTIAALRLLWDQRRFLGRISLAGLVAATIIVFLIPKRYTSTTRLMPPDENSGSALAMLAGFVGKSSSSSLGNLGSVGADLLGGKTTGELFAGVLQSRTVQDDLISKFDLRKAYGDKLWEDARKELTHRTDITIDRKSGIISVAVEDKSPQRAAALAQEYVAELNRKVAELNTSSAHRERVFLEGRLQQVQQNLESDETQFSRFASKNTTIDIQEQGKAMIEAGATLEGQLIAAQTELEGLRQVYTDNNIRVRETQARVDELRQELQKVGGADSSAGQQNNAASVSDGGLLYPPIRQLPILGVKYADLYRQMKVQEAVFEALTQEYELAKVEEAKETPSVKVLDPGDVPERKSFPPRTLIVFISTFFAMSVAVTWILGRAAWTATADGDPRKVFVAQVWNDVRGSLPWSSRNGYVARGDKKSL